APSSRISPKPSDLLLDELLIPKNKPRPRTFNRLREVALRGFRNAGSKPVSRIGDDPPDLRLLASRDCPFVAIHRASSSNPCGLNRTVPGGCPDLSSEKSL